MDWADLDIRRPTEGEIAKVIWPYGKSLDMTMDQTVEAGHLMLQAHRMNQARMIVSRETQRTLGVVSWYLSDPSFADHFRDYDTDAIRAQGLNLNRGTYCYVSEISLALPATLAYRVARKLILDTGASVLAFHDRRKRWREIVIWAKQ